VLPAQQQPHWPCPRPLPPALLLLKALPVLPTLLKQPPLLLLLLLLGLLLMQQQQLGHHCLLP
jgi:hypothetical protein